MAIRYVAAFLGVVSIPVMAAGQSRVALFTAPDPSGPALAHSGCGTGYAEIVATHFRVSADPSAPVLQRGTLKITAHRRSEEDHGLTPVSDHDTTGTAAPELEVPIRNGALQHAACMPLAAAYAISPMLYQMSVTDDSAGSALLLLVTADMTQPQYRLDDDALFRADSGDAVIALK